MIQICSLGGGVASTALFLMSLHGEIENPADAAVFADTGAELETTHNTIGKLTEYAKDFSVPVTVIRGELGDITTHNLQKPVDKHRGSIPFFSTNLDNKKMQTGKYCSNEFKTYPVFKYFRAQYGCTYKNPIENWLGYTIDELHRMKPSKAKYVVKRYPLIEKRIGRDECYHYLEKYGFTETVSSACWCYPFRRNSEYAYLSEEERQKAVQFEEDMNQRGIELKGNRLPILRIHPSLEKQSERPFDNPEQTDIFDDMCDGGSCFT